MSSLADMAKDVEQVRFIDRWCPETVRHGLVSIDEDNLRWNIARARAAEHELRQVKDALRVLRSL